MAATNDQRSLLIEKGLIVLNQSRSKLDRFDALINYVEAYMIILKRYDKETIYARVFFELCHFNTCKLGCIHSCSMPLLKQLDVEWNEHFPDEQSDQEFFTQFTFLIYAFYPILSQIDRSNQFGQLLAIKDEYEHSQLVGKERFINLLQVIGQIHQPEESSSESETGQRASAETYNVPHQRSVPVVLDELAFVRVPRVTFSDSLFLRSFSNYSVVRSPFLDSSGRLASWNHCFTADIRRIEEEERGRRMELAVFQRRIQLTHELVEDAKRFEERYFNNPPIVHSTVSSSSSWSEGLGQAGWTRSFDIPFNWSHLPKPRRHTKKRFSPRSSFQKSNRNPMNQRKSKLRFTGHR